MSLCSHVALSYMSFSCHFHTLLPFTGADDSCLSLARGRRPTVDSAFLLRMRLPLGLPLSVLHSCSCFFFSDLALCLVVSGHASTQTCAQEGSTGLHVWWILPSLSFSLVLHARVWHHLLGCLSRLFIANLVSLSALRLRPSSS